MKKIFVISGINIRKEGPLTIFYNYLDKILADKKYHNYHIVIMVSNKTLFEKYADRVEIIEFPKEKKSRILRFYYEYYWFKNYSKKNVIDIWLSLNDKTPAVKANHQYTYCHNPSMDYKCSFKDIYFYPTLFFYTLFYGTIYRINIEKNDAVIVQQNWLAKKFKERFPVKNVIVERPEYSARPKKQPSGQKSKLYTFIYPASPKSYKNCEVICEASKLIQKRGICDYKIIITIKGNENRYAKYLIKKYGNDKSIDFCGFQDLDTLEQMYADADCLVFPSKLETWGLPMTEFRRYSKPILAADLEYAHETLEGYEHVDFFDVEDEKQLSNLMVELINQK